MVLWILTFCALIAIVLISWFWKRQRLFTTFERIGIPGPKPNLLYGQYPEICKLGIRDAFTKYIKKYGPLTGIFFGTKPIVLVTDPEFIKIIQVKEYENFSKRDLYLDGGAIPGDFLKPSMILDEGQRWKTFRNLLTPFFNTAKLKEVVKLWNESVDNFFVRFDKIPNKEEDVEMLHQMKKITMDSIMKVAHSLNMGITANNNELFFHSGSKFFLPKFTDINVCLSMVLPEFINLYKLVNFILDWFKYHVFQRPSVHYVIRHFSSLIDFRNKEAKAKNDVLQRILNAGYLKKEDNFIKDVTKGEENPKDIEKLKKDTLIGDAIVFLIAGFETTAVLLGFLCHELAKNPDIQDKLRKELKDHLGERSIQHDDFLDLPYLDQVVNETLRLYPSSVTFVTRVNLTEYTYKGITFPKDTMFVVPIASLHTDPTLWENPMKFDPDRFSLERKGAITTSIYQPFGAGPRSCLGERYALKIAKVAFSRIIQRYRLELADNAPRDLQIEDHLFVIFPKNGIHVKALLVNE